MHAFWISAAQGPLAEEVRKDLDEVLAAGVCDLRPAQAIQKLPASERPALGALLLQSPHVPMRMQAVFIFRGFPPQVAGETFRKLLKDPGIRNEAACYLAREAKDAEARALLLKNAADSDPKVAVSAVRGLGSLGGPEIGPVLCKLLDDNAAPREARLAAVQAAGQARAKECTPALVALLADSALRGAGRGDTVRVCDMAASALEQIHGINHIVPPGAYYDFKVPVEKRDEGIALWRAWAAKERGAFEDASHRGAVRREEEGAGGAPARQAWPSPRDAYLDRLLEESLRTIAESRDAAKRAEALAKLSAGFQCTFCLGERAGVDALVAPSVRDTWRVMRVYEEKWWPREILPWQNLDLGFRRKFLPGQKGLDAAAPDAQAAAFLAFAEGERKPRQILAWGLARNFAEAFPKSALAAKAEEVKRRVEADFSKAKLRIVLHGHLPEAEPLAKPGTPSSNVRADGYTALWMNLNGEPSNWAHHQAVIEYKRATKSTLVDYPFFAQHSILYRGNEYMFLGSAAYQLRVRENLKLALEFADKAVLLNPGNPKCFAIRGMIRVVAKVEPEAALADLRKAAEMNPKSLGDEPETLAAACFLLVKTRAAGDGAAARALGELLGDLKPFNSAQPLKTIPEFAARLRGN